jgi:hypothetical protein
MQNRDSHSYDKKNKEPKSQDDSLRNELIERIQHVRKLEEGLMQRYDSPNRTRLLHEHKFFEPLLDINRFEGEAHKSGSKYITSRDERLVDIAAERVDEIKFAQDEISRNGDIVTMWAETGILLNRIIADKDLEISELQQQAELNSKHANSRIRELDQMVSNALEEQKIALNEADDLRAKVRELKIAAREQKVKEAKPERDATGLDESQALREAKRQDLPRSEPADASSSRLREELRATKEKLQAAELDRAELQAALRRDSPLSDRAARSAASLAEQCASLRVELEALRTENCVAESRLSELQGELRAKGGDGRRGRGRGPLAAEPPGRRQREENL